MRCLRGWMAVAVLFGAALSCGEGSDDPAAPNDGMNGTPAATESTQATEATDSTAAGFCSSTRNLVCGKDGNTYTNACLAGSWRRVAHIGACAGFVCNGVVCVSGFTCRTYTIYGVSVDQCAPDSGQPPTCTCASGSHCVQEASGATHCEADPPPPPAPNPSTLCDGKVCPAGMHCMVTYINYGAPSPSCMFN